VVGLNGEDWSLEGCPINGEVTLDKGLLKQSREVEVLCIARVGAATEHGEPLVLGGPCLGEKVSEKGLSCGADLLGGFGKAEY